MPSTTENYLAGSMGKVRVYKHKDSIRKLSDLMSSFSKVAGYDINIQNPVAFLFISDEDAEKKKIKEKLLFTVTYSQ